jgi:hypothetical protein
LLRQWDGFQSAENFVLKTCQDLVCVKLGPALNLGFVPFAGDRLESVFRDLSNRLLLGCLFGAGDVPPENWTVLS